MLGWGARRPYPSSVKKPMISCAICCVAGILNHNFPLKGLGSFVRCLSSGHSFLCTFQVFYCNKSLAGLSASATLSILCTDQEYFLLPIFIFIFILSAFFGGGGQLDRSWSHLGRGSLSQGIISNQIGPWTSLCVTFLVDD